jgi:hypothetical protein
MKLKILSILLFAIAIISLLTTCKKYPENDLWFKSPESAFKSGYLTAFTVDGEDSIPMWNSLYNTGPDYNGYWPPNSGFPFEMKEIFFQVVSGKTIESYIGSGSFHFYDNKKYLYIYFKMEDKGHNLPKPTHNIFYSDESTWKILKLTKSGTMRIQRTYNGKVYEMEFN